MHSLSQIIIVFLLLFAYDIEKRKSIFINYPLRSIFCGNHFKNERVFKLNKKVQIS